MFFGSSKNSKLEAEQAYAAQKWKKSLSLYLAVKKENGFDPKTSQRLAELYKKLNEPTNAVAEYKLLFRHYSREGFWAKAMSVCKICIELSPGDLEAQEALSTLHRLKFGAPTHADRPVQSQDPRADAEDLWGSTIDLPSDHTIEATTSTLGKPISQVEHIPLFSDLSPAEFLALVSRLTVKQFPPDAHIIEEGDLGRTMYLITDGRVEVSTKSASGEKTVIARLGGGEFFGEQSMLDQTPRSATVEARTDVEVLELDQDQLDLLCAQHPRILKQLRHFVDQRFLEKMLLRSTEFASLNDQERKVIASKITSQYSTADTVIIEEGSTGNHMYFIKRGTLDVYATVDQKRVGISTLQAGDFFGEVSMLTGRVRTASVKARTECELLVLSRESAASVLRGNMSVLKLLQEKIQHRSKDLAETIESFRESATTLGLV